MWKAGRLAGDAGYRTIRPSGRTDWLLIVTTTGRGRVRQEDRTQFVDTGTAVVFPPGVAHDYGTDPETGFWEILFFHFESSPQLVRLLDWPRVLDGVLYRSIEPVSGEVTRALQESAVLLASGNPDRHYLGADALERALRWCGRVHPERPRYTMQGRCVLDSRVAAACDLISAQYRDSLCLTDISSHVGLSRSRMSHLFKSQTGTSVLGYIEAVRIAEAQRLLCTSDRTVSDIATAVGYTDPLHFSRRFRRSSGLSPARWRRLRMSGSAPM